jgi:hypothetical protein
LDDLLEPFLDFAPNGGIARQENESDAILAGVRKSDARRLADFGEKLVRHLNQDARAVAGIDLGSRGAAVVEVAEHLQAIRDRLVRLAPVHIDDESDAARFVLKPGVVQPLFDRQTG